MPNLLGLLLCFTAITGRSNSLKIVSPDLTSTPYSSFHHESAKFSFPRGQTTATTIAADYNNRNPRSLQIPSGGDFFQKHSALFSDWIQNSAGENFQGSKKRFSFRRNLAIGDFEELNTIFQGAVIMLPNTVVDTRVVGITLTLDITNLRCTNIAVGDITLVYTKDSLQRLSTAIDVIELDLTCFLDYTYRYGFLRGSGSSDVYTDNNGATVSIVFDSSNFNLAPPSSVSVGSCTTQVNVVDLDFRGGFVSSILNVFEQLIRGTVESEVETTICSELNSLGDSFGANIIQLAQETLDPYLRPILPNYTDPLYPERILSVPPTTTLLDFKDTEGTIGSWFNEALQEIDALLGLEVSDPGGPTGTGTDLGINKFLRDNLLDSERAFTITKENLTDIFDGVIFQGHDQLTQTNITMDAVRITGLDTFTRFEPLLDIGRYTLQNELSWRFLTIDVDVSMAIKPSTLPDSLISNPGAAVVEESARITFGVDDVNAFVSVLLAIDQDALGALELGPLLSTSNLLSCLMSTVFKLEISGLDVQIANIRDPTIDGFISVGLDRVISTGVEILFVMYEAVLLQASPSIFQTTLRNILNKNVIGEFLNDPSNVDCPDVIFSQGPIDLRDLLLSPEVSNLVGGTGTEPYGDLGSLLRGLIVDQLLAVGDNGLPTINTLLIAPLTESQSGVAGSLLFPNELINFEGENFTNDILGAFVDHFQFSAFNTSIYNIDTLTLPLSIIEPSTNPYLLMNLLTLGPMTGRDLTGKVTMSLSVSGDAFPFDIRNDFEVTATIPRTTIGADLIAKIDGLALSSFPLKNFLNANCWLAAMSPGALVMEDIIASAVNAKPNLGFSSFLLSLGALTLNAECVSCSSSGLDILPNITSLLQDTGSINVLRARVELFAEELLVGDWVEEQINRWLDNAPQSCPHHALYNASSESDLFSLAGFPSLSRSSIESLVFTGALVFDVAIVVLAETHLRMVREPTDPLSAQKNLSTSSGEYLDWNDLSEDFGDIGNDAFEELRDYLNGKTASEEPTLNELLRDILLDENRSLSVDFDDIAFSQAGTQISLESLRVVGLDSFSAVDVLVPIGPQTLKNELSLDKIKLELDIGIMIDSGNSDSGTSIASLSSAPSTQQETMTISFGVEQVDLSLAVFLAVNGSRLGEIELGSLLNTSDALSCILTAVDAVETTQLIANVGSVSTPRVIGFLSPDISAALDESVTAVFETYNSRLLEAMPLVFDETIRRFLNAIVDQLKGDAACAPNTATPTTSTFIDFRDLLLSSQDSMMLGGDGSARYGFLFREIKNIIDAETSRIDEPNRTSLINDFLIGSLVGSDEGGRLVFDGDLLNTDARIQVGGLDARIGLNIRNLTLNNLDTVGPPLSLLDPVNMEPYHLNNTATLGAVGKPLQFGFIFLISFVGDDDTTLRNEVEISVDLQSATVVLELLARISEISFMQFPLRDILNINCWLATMPAPPLDATGVRLENTDPSAALTNLIISLSQLSLNVTCISCTSPEIEELSRMLSDPTSVEDVTAAGNDVLDYVTTLLGGEFLQVQIDRFLNEAPKSCPHRPEYQENPINSVFQPFASIERSEDSISLLIALVVSIACLVGVVTFAVLLVKFIVRRRNKAWVARLPEEYVLALYMLQEKQEAKTRELNQTTQSMFMSDAIPCYVRYIVPVVIVGNIGFFLSGHLSLGATVNAEAKLAGQTITVSEFFEFSLARSTVDIWNAGGQELAILILIFSGVWPYTKQLITLALWFLPPRVVSLSTRGSTFLWLDALAKWSMVDIFVLVVSVAAFRVSVKSPEVSFLPEGFYSVDLLVVPLWGLYANMIAQLISQVSSHFIIHYHRRIVGAASDEYDRRQVLLEPVVSEEGEDPDGGEENDDNVIDTTQRLKDHTFARPHRVQGDELRVRKGVSEGLLGVAGVLVVLVIVACSVSSFSLEVLGIIGVAVEIGQEFKQAITKHSIFTIIELLFDEASYLGTFQDYLGLGFLSLLFLSTVMFVPILQALMLLRQWFWPLSEKARRRTSIMVETLQAWQYMEVYLITIVVSMWQLGPVSEFMINSYCDGLESTFSTLVFYGILTEDDAQCFRVQARVESATYVFIAAAVILALFNTFVMRANTQFERDNSNARVLLESVGMIDEDELKDIDTDAAREAIRPVSVLFSDTFRWLLHHKNLA